MDEVCTGRREEESLPQESEASESSTSASSSSRLISWRPRALAFRPYSPILDTNAKPQHLRVVVRRPLVARLTKDIVEIYQLCNPKFHYSEELNPKRFLTSPSTGLLNDGCDNANSDLILTVNYSLVNSDTKRRYIVKDILGHGTFGQVAKCWVAETNSFVAVKIIKNLPAYYQQALVEVSILTTLNKKFDPEDKHHIVRIYDYFVYQRHLCIAFELLETNLVKPAEIKIIDFGSACMEDRTVISIYRVDTTGLPRFFLDIRLPLFPGASEFDLLRRMIKILGGQPPDYILRKAKNTSKFFKFIGSINREERDENHRSNCSMYQVLTEEEYAARESKKPSVGKEYFNHMNLEAIVTKYPYRKNLAEEELVKESQVRLALIDFLRGLVEFDPAKRWSPLQASKHPFVTGEPFTCPYKPVPETPHMPVSQNVKVDHHPAGGHWFAAGLSPNISGRNRGVMPNSPHYQLMSYVHPGSYGSLGSHGSYNEGLGLGSSYGSYGDSSNFHAFYSPAGPSGMNIYAQSGISILGNSPDTRRIMQLSHGNGIGFSPGNFAPMSLGSSPSQFTPPSTYSQISAGSPGQYGPPSPVRGNCHGSPLGKMASGSHYNRRKNWAFQGNFQSQETTSSSSCQGHIADINTSCQSEGNPSVSFGSQSHRQLNTSTSTWRPQQGGRSITSGYSSSHMHTVQGSGYDKSEASNSLPDPGDWDPNYSEELLLQEDSSDMSIITSEFMKGMHLSQPLVSSESQIGVGISSRISNASVSIQRHDGPVQSFSPGEAGSSPAIHGYAHMTNQSYFMPHSAQSSPSRLGQQPIQRHNLGRSAPFRDGEWSHLNVQAPQYSGGLRSPGSKDMHWGRRGNYSVSNAPAFHGRKDYGRNA
ncbi:Dual specificity protein kinase YAK1 [Sesamum angolense]|uniref:Dual specificity protein kinase YAK1 n=1 Tax=Sesamum angolense TaxID=2727404 RepID=A0AAE1TCP6_9LAMI|nr:Dual specificity protein kinase YAK1 [Sesamum angolense]